jgi:hypothetical protein
MNQNTSKSMTKPTIAFLSANILSLTLIIVPRLFGLYYVFDLTDSILGTICVFSFFIWVFLIFKHKTKRMWPRIIVIVVSVIALVINIWISLVILVFHNSVFFESVSPSGINTLVVFERTFLDSSYSAYPRILSIFYKYQDNGFVRKHDFWGHAEIQVEWVSDNYASVKVITGDFDSDNGSNIDDVIIVTFD